eukprot:m.150930 g.150930  ORF g.150930 m.150930 type:complete len:105 (+) comp38558_c1_seq3:34-348(+)
MLLLFAFLNTLLAFKSVAQNADALSGVLTLLANDGLGVSTLQSEYNSLAYTAISVDPQSAVEELSSVLDGKFEKRRQVAMSLNDAVHCQIAHSSMTPASVTILT